MFQYSYDLSGNITSIKKGSSEDALVNYRAYTYDDLGQLLSEKQYNSSGTLTKTITYTYDGYGNLSVIKYYKNDTDYNIFYVMTNVFGDVISLHNADGTTKVTYEYDAWGNVISMTDTTTLGIGTINPIRYRGYYYDAETGLYYLSSRYYDPQVGRFINTDGQINADSMSGYNLFAYCYNNPISLCDRNGARPIASMTVDTEKKTDKKTSFRHVQKIINAKNKEQLDQIRAFAAIVYAEAGGENTKTKKAVAHSINNRISIGHWTKPTNIIEAISSPWQYEAYNNTRYKAAIEYYTTGKSSTNDSLEIASMRECYNVVIPIYFGTERDFTNGVVYFHSFRNPQDWPFHYDYDQVTIIGTEGFWWYRE